MKARSFSLCLTVIFMILATGLFAGGEGETAGMQQYDLKMMTGSAGGTWYPTGAAIAEFLQRDIEGLTITVVPGGGVSNIQAIQDGLTDLGMGKSPTTVLGLMGKEPFSSKCDKVTNLMFLMEEHLQIIVREDSPIQSVHDFRGKTLVTAKKGSSGELMLQQLLDAYDMSYDDLSNMYFLSFADTVSVMKDGRADGWVLSTSLPAATVLDLATARSLRYISLEEDKNIANLAEINPAYIVKTVPAGAYDFIKEPIHAVTTSLHMALSEDLPEDLVYKMAESIINNIDAIKAVHKNYQKLTPELVASDIGVPMHPGAQKYYKEAGLSK